MDHLFQMDSLLKISYKEERKLVKIEDQELGETESIELSEDIMEFFAKAI